ncbi:MAG TPA: type II toxin-antitoxin system VapC family toxin [Candidatus Saccharimonadia bacterium]|nr:type II toxin-antitoxin system VapC family toxin [Candidatus Saccharimonadia bacterium]
MILLDANILLEILIAGRPRSDTVMQWFEHNESPCTISLLTVHLVLHFGIKDGLSIKTLQTFLADYAKEALLPEDYAMALRLLKGPDHEDALQLAVAERTDCTAIVTLDKSFAKTYQHLIPFTVL